MYIEHLHALRVNRPAWFARADFRKWLTSHRGLATWHVPGLVGEYSDIFLLYDHGDCGDIQVENFPSDIYHELVAICINADFDYGLLWITNVDDKEEDGWVDDEETKP